MATNVTMPQLGLTMTEGTVTKWFKTVGDAVKTGEVLVEVSTDKINNQVEAPVDGVVLQIAVPEGGTAPVKAVLAVLGAAGEQVAPAQAAPAVAVAQAAATAPAAPATVPVVAPGVIKASPVAKKLAREHGLNLADITGSGPDGRIVERDVLQHMERQRKVKTTPMAAKMAAEYGVDLTTLAKDGRITKADVLAAAAPAAPAQAPAAPASTAPSAGRTVPLAGMRKIIASRMSASWQAPHVTYNMTVNMAAARDFRASLQDTVSKKYGVRLSYTDLIVKACAVALRDMPEVNVSLSDDTVVYHEDINIGVAVALDQGKGLIVPVVTAADRCSLGELGHIIRDLTTRAREGRLTADEISGGTFTVSNLGMYGIDIFTPIVNPPESAILGVGRIADTPVVVDGAVTVAPLMQLSLSADHRTIDGALAAQFLQKVKQYLEEPLLLVC